MKMTKKLLLGAAVAATFMLSSCMRDLGTAKIYINENYDGTTGSIATATIDYTNEDSKEWARGMKFMRTDRSDITVKFVIENQSQNQEPDGVMGLAFNAEEIGKYKEIIVDEEGNETEKELGIWNFMLLGTRWEKGKAKYYISHYYNIKEGDVGKKNLGAYKDGKDNVKTAFDPKLEEPYEVVIKPVADLVGVTLKGDTEGDKTLEVAVRLTALTDADAGKYRVEFYDGDALTKGGIADEAEAIVDYTCTVNECLNAPLVDEEGNSVEPTKISNKLGCYANVYCEKTLVGEWRIWDIAGNPIVADWIEPVAANPIF